jgi:basic amino acid/polyamine antiporter, APA family
MQMTRQLGFLQVFSITSGAMISSGLFILPGIAHAHAGPAVVFSYFLAGLLAVSGMLSMVEITTAMPMAGGNYFFITRTLGPAVGTVAGLLNWFSLALKSAFALVGISAFLVLVVDWNFQIVSSSLCLIFIGVNIIGSKETGRLQVFLIAGLLALMLLYILWGLPHVEGRNMLPFAPNGWVPVVSTAGLIFVSYGGLLQVGSVAEEIRNPGRVVPLAMISSFIVILLFYILMLFVTTGVLGSAVINHSLTPISDGAGAFMGRPGVAIMSMAAILAFVSTANAGIMTASRYLYSLSRDKLLPGFFGTMNERFQTPHRAVVATGFVVIGSLFLHIELLAEVASTVLLLTYLLSNLCLIILRESRIFNYKPVFRAPWYPALPIAGIAGYILLLVGVGWDALLISAALIGGGFLFYWFYGRIKAQREYALLHLVERVSDRELTNGMLESELKQIIIHRESMEFDRFDKIAEGSVVIDCPPSVKTQDELFRILGETIKEKFNFDSMMVTKALAHRHRQESIILQPGFALSDIIVEGENFFEMLLIRLCDGIALEEHEDSVHAFFLLVTTRDERNFYLKAVASIAQLIQDPSFAKQWSNAVSPQQLKDLVILGDRRRVSTS